MGWTELLKDRHLVPFGMPGSMSAPAGSPEGQRSPTGHVVAALCEGLRYPEHLRPLQTVRKVVTFQPESPIHLPFHVP